MRSGLMQVLLAILIIAGGVFFFIFFLTPAPNDEPSLNIAQRQGLALVTSYCADCHSVGSSGDSLHSTAPRFRELHQRYDVTFLEEALVEGLIAHPDMPEFEFDTNQAMAIIEYLDVLQAR